MGLFSFLKGKFSKAEDEKTKKYEKGLEKSRKAFADRLHELSRRYKSVNADYFEELEEILISADVGVETTLGIIDDLLRKSQEEKISDPSAINDLLVDRLFVSYLEAGGAIENEIRFAEKGPTVLLMVGANGVGKTTSIAKLAYRYQQEGKSIMLVAGDTFRAGAREQLAIWAKRLNCPILIGQENADPASVAYDGVQKALKENIDLCIVDTAGRLQTKAALMNELSKIRRVIGKEVEGAPHETFLVIDATTGQNGVSQAKAFAEAAPLTGIVITKMDGTSKGGIILSIREEIGVPVRYIGLGEKMDDLEEFDLERYLNGLLASGEEDGR